MSWGIILTCIASGFAIFFLGFCLCSVLVFFKSEEKHALDPNFLMIKLSDRTVCAKITAIEFTDLSSQSEHRIEGKELRRILYQIKKC